MSSDTENASLQHLNRSLSEQFSAALIKARGNRSQAEFARLLGIANQQTYQRYERGLIPSGAVLYNIATRLGLTVDELLTGGKVAPEAAELIHRHGVMSASDLEEAVQFTIAVTAFCEVMTSKQLLVAVSKVLNNARLTNESKGFWTKLLGEWAIVKSKVEEQVPELAEKATGRAVSADTSINFLHSKSGSDGQKYLTKKDDKRRTVPMPTWAQLKSAVARLTKERGAKAALARHCRVTRQAVATWLDEGSSTEPGAEATLRLLDWVTANGMKLKSPGSAITPPEQMTPKKDKQKHESPTSGPQRRSQKGR